MLMSFATLALLTLYVALGVCGVALARRRRGIWRIAGVVLAFEAALALAAQVTLSTLPFGIGEPLIRVPFVNLLLQSLAALAAVVGVAALVFLLARRLAATPRSSARMAALLIGVPLVASAAMYGMVYASTPERERERDPNKRQITLPQGFVASVYARSHEWDNPTVMTFGPDDRLYVGDINGTIWVISDAKGPDAPASITKLAEGFALVLGLAWRDGELFVASQGKIEALRSSRGDGILDQRRLVVDNLPSMVLRPHSNNSIVFGPDGRLYFGVGSTTSGDYEQHPLAAAVLSVNPDGSDLKVFARGFGNTFGVAFNSSGDLFGGDNSVGDEPDEFNYIVEDGNYGYPYFYGDPPKNLGTIGALATFPNHSSPTGVTFYSGSTYPAEYRDNAFVALWNRGEIGRVEVARTSGGRYLSRTSTFGSGFLYPIAVANGPDGDLYVADFGTSAVYRISHTAQQ